MGGSRTVSSTRQDLSCFLTGFFWEGCVMVVFSVFCLSFSFIVMWKMLLEDAIQKWAAYFG